MLLPSTIISLVDEIRPNTVTTATKKGWLARCDQTIYDQVIARHFGADDLVPYKNETRQQDDPPEYLMIDDPYGTPIYEYYLISMIDQTNGDTARYNNDSIVYNAALQVWAKKWHREHMPIPGMRFRV